MEFLWPHLIAPSATADNCYTFASAGGSERPPAENSLRRLRKIARTQERHEHIRPDERQQPPVSPSAATKVRTDRQSRGVYVGRRVDVGRWRRLEIGDRRRS